MHTGVQCCRQELSVESFGLTKCLDSSQASPLLFVRSPQLRRFQKSLVNATAQTPFVSFCHAFATALSCFDMLKNIEATIKLMVNNDVTEISFLHSAGPEQALER